MYSEVIQKQDRYATSLIQAQLANSGVAAEEGLLSFEELYDQYFPRLYAYLSYRVDNSQDAEDLVAETFLKVVKGLPSFKAEHQHSFAAWLFRIAHNTLVSFQRDRQHWQELVTTLTPEVTENLPAPQNQLPEEQMLKQEQIRIVRRMLESLAPRQQEVLKLKFFGELRNQEIAAILELDERSVSAYLHRGLEELQRRYLPAQAAQQPPVFPGDPVTLPKRGAMSNQPKNSSSLPFGVTPLQGAEIFQPQNWLESVHGSGIANPTNFALSWFNAYLQKAIPQADQTFRLQLKAYLLTQLVPQ